MITATAQVRTERASRYLVQLCKHFGHKVPAEWSKTGGSVQLPMGKCRMAVTDGTLTLICEAEDTDALTQMQAVIGDHFVRFAWKEKLSVDWTREQSSD